MPAFADITGRTFGQLTVLERVPGWTANQGVIWRCQCSCGRVKNIRGANLKNGNSTTCGHKFFGAAHPSWKGCGDITGTYWGDVLHGAERRGLRVEITIEQAWEIFRSQNGKCALSGWPIHIKKYQQEGTASLDRINNSSGYAPGNVQWLHKMVNRVKMDYPQSEFIAMCRAVAERN